MIVEKVIALAADNNIHPPTLEPKYQYLIELKHLKKKDAPQLSIITEEGRTQLHRYLSHPDIAWHGDVVGYLLVVAGYEVKVVVEIRA